MSKINNIAAILNNMHIYLLVPVSSRLIIKALAKRYNFAVQHYRTLLDTTLFDRLSPHVGPTFMLEKMLDNV